MPAYSERIPAAAAEKAPLRLVQWLGLGAGILFLAITPPFDVPDEPAHFFRAYAMSEGRLRAEVNDGIAGAWLPAEAVAYATSWTARLGRSPAGGSLDELPRDLTERLFIRVPHGRQPTPVSSSALGYTPLLYVPAAAAIAAGRSLDAAPPTLLYLARAANLIVALILTVAAVRRVPFGGFALGSAALLPMLVVLRSSASTDGILAGVAFLFIALALRIAVRAEAGRLDFAALSLLAFLLGAAKPPYAVLALAVLAIPWPTGNRGWRIAGQASVVVAAAAGVAYALWWLETLPRTPGVGQTIARADRVEAALGAPLWFMSETLLHFWQNGRQYLIEVVGKLGWLDRPFPWSFVVIYAVASLLVAIIDGPATPTARRTRIVFGAVFLLGLVAVAGALYVGTPAEAGFLSGVQGRYFIPLLPAALLVIGSATARGEVANSRIALAAWLLSASGLIVGVAVALRGWS